MTNTRRTPPPAFVQRAHPNRVSANDVIGVGAREARVVSVQREGVDLQDRHQVWAIDDAGEAVLAEWDGNRWTDRL